MSGEQTSIDNNYNVEAKLGNSKKPNKVDINHLLNRVRKEKISCNYTFEAIK